MTVEGWSRGSRLLVFAFVAVASGCYAPRASRSLGMEALLVQGAAAPSTAALADRQVISVASERSSVTVDALDDAQVESSVRTIVSSRVPGIAIERVNGHSQLHIDARVNDDRRDRPLFVIDGVPLAADYGVMIASLNLARIDLVTDTLLTRLYGPRAKAGLVLVSLRNR
jgi:TonB-dependent Receptor Plug Domain